MFGPPRFGELLYSVIARLKVHLVSISPKNLITMLFDNRNAAAIIDLPCNLQKLIDKMPGSWPYTAEGLIYDNTLYPFYAPFLSKDTSSKLFGLMRGNNGGSIHTITGIMASDIKTIDALRFCPLCFARDIKEYGEGSWYRVHQVPGVLMCPEHAALLLESSIRLPLMNKHEYYHANRSVCKVYPFAVKYSAKTMAFLLDLAKDVQWLVNERILPKGLNWFHDRYMELLIERGFATCSGRVDQIRLHEAFTSFYGKEFLDSVQSPLEGQDSWLARLVRKPRVAVHPIRHLLLIRFLTGSPEEFFSERAKYRPFGKAPWPCLNAAADHYLKRVVKQLHITYCGDTKRPVGHFTCFCGFEYSRRGPDTSTRDIFRIGRVVEFGPVWKSQLAKLASQGMSLRAIARNLNVDTNTVRKYLALEHKQQVDIAGVDEIGEIATLNCHRGIWQQGQADNPGSTKTQLRYMYPRSFAWLYRNDREWLRNNSPLAFKRQSYSFRVDWEGRDRLICDKIKDAVKTLMSIPGKPERVTIARLGKIAGVLGLVQKHLDKMPITKEYLNSVVESFEDCMVRRVQWAFRESLARAKMPTREDIEQMAGLRRGSYSERVENSINNCFNEARISKMFLLS